MDGAAQIGDHRRQIARLRHKLRYGFIRNRCGHAPSLRALSLLCHNASLSPLRNRENAANPRAARSGANCVENGAFGACGGRGVWVIAGKADIGKRFW
jgi:hypothetical protein